jgi:subtilisin family serine protease
MKSEGDVSTRRDAPMPYLPRRGPLTAFLALGLFAWVVGSGRPQEQGTPEGPPPKADPYPAKQRAYHLTQLGADRWHATGYRGQGVKVAVLDSGFRGYRDQLGKALPVRVVTQSFRRDGNLEAKDSQHGILCAEVVHAVAPDAEILLANWEPDCPAKFLEAVAWARQQGARVVTCSVIMPSWSDGQGHGTAHDELRRLAGSGERADDLLVFASAGNIAQRHWSGTFRSDADGFHLWDSGRTDNTLSPWDGHSVSVELSWPKGPAYEVCVRDASTGGDVGTAVRIGEEGCSRVVRFAADAGHRYSLRVRQTHGEAGSFRLVVLGAGVEYSSARGSISFPGDGPEVVAVGAVDDHGRRLSYSSCGPNSDKPKPDLVAAVPFPSLWRSVPFSGTSAAAPQAAGLAALWCSRHPEWSSGAVRSAMARYSRDLGPPGHDFETGFGQLCLPVPNDR